MKEVIYLAVSPERVERMTKSVPQLRRGEIPVKVLVEVSNSAFREPVLETRIVIEDWRQGIDIADVQLAEGVITETEAQLIRDRRLAEMRKILETHGYKVVDPTAEEA